MLSKISLMASTLGLAVVGTGSVDQTIPAHITLTNIDSAYTFESEDSCRSKLHALYAENPVLRGKLRCSQK